jgi:hypothetical protein
MTKKNMIVTATMLITASMPAGNVCPLTDNWMNAVESVFKGK